MVKKTKKNYLKNNRYVIDKIPLMFLFTIGVIFLLISTYRDYSYLYNQLGLIFLYFSIIIFLIFLFKFYSYKVKKTLIKEYYKKSTPIDILKSPSFIKFTCKNNYESVKRKRNKHSDSFFLVYKKRLAKLSKERKNIYINKRKTYEKKINLIYIGVQSVVAILFPILFIRWFPLALREGPIYYGFLDIVILLICSGIAYVLMKWILLKKNSRGKIAILGLLVLTQILSLGTGIIFLADIIFKLNYLFIILYLYRAVVVYTGIMLIWGMLASIIKKDVFKNYNYDIPLYLPFQKIIYKKKETMSLNDILELYTGLSFKSLLSIKYIFKLFPFAILGLVFLLFLSTSIYKIEAFEKGAVYTFGSLNSKAIKGPGLHIKLPWPMEKVKIYDVDRVKSLLIGYEDSESKDFLWDLAHSGKEYMLLLGNGNELVSVNIKLTYHIDNLYDYLTKTSSPEKIIMAKADAILTYEMISTNLEIFLSVDRSNLSEFIKDELKKYCEINSLGITIDKVIIASVHPPVEIADVYQSVVGAGIKSKTIITKAETEGDKILKSAEQEAETAVISARARQIEKVANANHEMLVYQGSMDAYTLNPKSFKLYKHLMIYENLIKNNKVYVFSPNIKGDLSNFFINYKDRDAGEKQLKESNNASDGIGESSGLDPAILYELSKEER